jgi:hypothetical protein
MTTQALSKLSKKAKIITGAIRILFGLLGISFGVYIGIHFYDGHPKVLQAGIWLWLVVTSFYCVGRGIKQIYDLRRAA